MYTRTAARSALALTALLLTTCTESPTTPGSGPAGSAPSDLLQITVTALDFGDVSVGTTSATQTVDVTNNTGAPVVMTGTGGAPGGDFSASQDCEGTTLNPGESCHMFFSFAPSSMGAATATSSGTWNGLTYAIALQGNGTPPTLVHISETALGFGDVAVGTTSLTDTVNVTNISGAPIVMSGAGGAPANTDFSASQNCQGNTLNPGESCQMFFTFTPSATGPASSASNITWNGQPFSIALSGSGVSPRFKVSPLGIDFGEVPLGTTSVTDTVDITNLGGSPVVMSGAGGAPANTDFSASQNCQGNTLNPGESCRMFFTFTPSGMGPASSASNITWNGVPFNIALNGTGIASGSSPTAALWISETALGFGDVEVGTTSLTDTVNVTNISGAPIVMSGAGGAPANTDFSASQNCQGNTLNPGESCQMFFTFTPSATGPASSASNITWNGQPFSIALSGSGVSPRFKVSPLGIDFGEVPLGTTSVTDTVDITNLGGSPVVMSGAGGAPANTDFSASQNCQGNTLNPGESCQMFFTFTPSAAGPASSASNITWNGVPFDIALQGTGGGAKLLITPVGFDFGPVAIGSTSPSQTTNVTNVGSTPIVMSGTGGAPGGAFDLVQDCEGVTLAPGATCHMFFSFSPTVLGPASASAVGTWNGQAFDISLVGNGENPYQFSGFFPPLDEVFPAFHQATAGQAIPVKFSLGGDFGLHVLAPDSPASGPVDCATGAPVTVSEPTRNPGHSGLSYSAGEGQYNYVWKTERAWAGTCRQLVLTLTDGSEYRANVQFR